MADTTARRPTILDVAKEAGVSKGTVSRVINGHDWVSEASRAAVVDAMRRTGFVANASARSLATRRTGSIALILGGSATQLFTDPNYALILQTISEEVSDADHTLAFLIASRPAERQRLVRFLRGGHVDAAAYLTTGESETDEFVRLMREHPIPFMVAGRPFGDADEVPFVAAQEHEGGELIGRHFVERGYRRVGVVATHLENYGARLRVEGFRRAVGERLDRRHLIEVDEYSADAGREGLRALLDRTDDLGAVFATSDVLASGVVAEAQSRGLIVPKNMAVAGFDDSTIAARMNPPLTTVRQDVAGVAREIVHRLLAAVDGARLQSATVPVSLVVRAST